MKIEFDGKTAVVTGGAGGIGSACVKELLESGAKVAVVDVNEEAIQSVLESYRSCGEIRGYCRNLTNVEEIRRLVGEICQDFGGIDILVQTAGLLRQRNGLDLTEPEWDQMMAVNSKALFFMMQQTVEQSMKARGGVIVNFASMAGIRGMNVPMAAAHYTASKGAVVSMTMQAAVEWAQYGVRVNAVAPGGVMTPAMAKMDFDKNLLDPVPLKKLSKPENIADAVVFLSSDKASMITGQTLVIDGGSSVVGY